MPAGPRRAPEGLRSGCLRASRPAAAHRARKPAVQLELECPTATAPIGQGVRPTRIQRDWGYRRPACDAARVCCPCSCRNATLRRTRTEPDRVSGPGSRRCWAQALRTMAGALARRSDGMLCLFVLAYVSTRRVQAALGPSSGERLLRWNVSGWAHKATQPSKGRAYHNGELPAHNCTCRQCFHYQ